ncbi:nucleoid occlusion factor SlmA, partial [Staphylococcus aureus]|nr:nucleoid occlusion factor SlmA [Staphylococcus aureus]
VMRVQRFLAARCADMPAWRGAGRLTPEEFLERHGQWNSAFDEGALFYYLDEYVKHHAKDMFTVFEVSAAALAARLGVSEAALYRHFASKAQMFEGLIAFIEQTVFGLINQITAQEEHGLRQVQAIVRMLLSFAEKNPGMTRVLTGEALVGEHERLQERINQLVDRIEASIRQC